MPDYCGISDADRVLRNKTEYDPEPLGAWSIAKG